MESSYCSGKRWLLSAGGCDDTPHTARPPTTTTNYGAMRCGAPRRAVSTSMSESAGVGQWAPWLERERQVGERAGVRSTARDKAEGSVADWRDEGGAV